VANATVSDVARSVLVAGGSGGLGGAVVARLAADGWRVVVADRRAGSAEMSRDAQYVIADLFDPDAAASAVEVAAGEPDSPLGAVVNLVGGFAAGGLVHQTSVDQFEEQLRLNLRAAYLVCHFAVPHLLGLGRGSIVCVSSRAAVQPFPGAAGYVTAKAAVLGLVDALAVEYRSSGIRANAVLPSIIDTPANRAAQPDADVSRWVAPSDVADVIAYLCSDASFAVSGAHIPVYGEA